MNKAMLVGKLTKLHHTGGEQTAAALFTVMCSRSGRYDYIDCVAFRGTADYIHIHLNEGDFISVEGALQYNRERKKLEVIAQEVHCIAHGRTWEEVE